MKNLFYVFLIIFALSSSGCLNREEFKTSSTKIPTKVDKVLPITPSPASLRECWGPDWQIVWGNSQGNRGQLRSIKEGPKDVFWFLTDFALDKVVAQEKSYKFYRFQDLLHCEKCQDLVNDTFAISSKGDAWLGLTTGLLIIKSNGEWEQIPTQSVLPTAKQPLGLRVLLADNKGNIWVSNSDNLCFYNGSSWKCHQIDGLKEKYLINQTPYDETAEILSAVSGNGDQVWFGTQYGRIIFFDGNKFDVYNLNHLTDSSFSSINIGSMAFDNNTNNLWALNTRAGYFKGSIGIFRRDSNGSWQTFQKELFFTSERDENNFLPFTAITIAQDGKVWLGMDGGLALVYYDGRDWRTFDGSALPLGTEVKSSWNFSSIMGCSLPNERIVDVLTAQNGGVIIGNQPFGFIYRRIQKNN
jgi:hypothetical protein